MGDGARQVLQGIPLKEIDAKGGRDDPWVAVEGGGDGSDVSDSESSIGSSSFGEDSANSVGSSSSSDLMEDASSSASSASSSSLSNASLYDLSDLMEHLPIKRGLSKYFKGKSQSFTSLARVKSIEDLAKRVSSNAPCRKKIKACQSYGGGLDGQKLHSPKAAISKKVAKGYGLSSLGKRPPNLGACRVPYPAQKT